MTLRLAAAAAVPYRPSAAPVARAPCSHRSLRSTALLRVQQPRPLPLSHLRRQLLRTAGSTAAGAGEDGTAAEAVPAAEQTSPAAGEAEPRPTSSSAAASSSTRDSDGDAPATVASGDAAPEGLDGLMRAARLSFAAAKLEVAKTEAAKLDAKREAARAEAAQAEAELEALQASGAVLRSLLRLLVHARLGLALRQGQPSVASESLTKLPAFL